MEDDIIFQSISSEETPQEDSEDKGVVNIPEDFNSKEKEEDENVEHIDIDNPMFRSVAAQDAEVDEIEPSVIFMETEAITTDYSVFGVTFLGRQHQVKGERCQDFHLFSDLGDGWHLYIVSDGAGSAKASHRGAKINCEVTTHLIGKMIDKLCWKTCKELPTAIEWQMEFTAVCRMLRDFVVEKTETLDEPIESRDFNATLLVLIVTPQIMLAGHIGDGRIGYRDKDGEWHSLITPHKGEEQNQTIFVMNPWDKVRVPALKMSGVFVPETNIIVDKPQCVTLLSDGCENFSWNCLQSDMETGYYCDINTPFPGFWEPLLKTIETGSEEPTIKRFITFVDRNTQACRDEEDDRSMLIGIYNTTSIKNDSENTNK